MRRSTGPDRDTVMLVLDRDGYRCVRDGVPIQGERGTDWVLHHRRPRAMGGTRRDDANSPANLLSLCAPCHAFVESFRSAALSRGWIVLQHEHPAAVAVLVNHGARWVYLTEDGRYEDCPPAVAS